MKISYRCRLLDARHSVIAQREPVPIANRSSGSAEPKISASSGPVVMFALMTPSSVLIPGFVIDTRDVPTMAPGRP